VRKSINFLFIKSLKCTIILLFNRYPAVILTKSDAKVRHFFQIDYLFFYIKHKNIEKRRYFADFCVILQGMIDRNTIERILEAAHIEDVVGEFVSLRRAGTVMKGLCPFHDEKTPSFVVSPTRGIYKCFGCGKGGNVVHFIMEHEQLSYPEALRWLARRYNIEIKERELSAKEIEANNARESLYIVNEWMCRFYQNTLMNTDEGRAYGRAYFRNRGVRDDIIEKFRLGFSPADAALLPTRAVQSGYNKENLKRTGNCYEREDGSLRDRFHGRVIFPWMGVSGKVIGFGGRLLDSRTKGVSQKYVNSPESEIFSKRKELYGFFQAKRAIAKYELVYMVEGYTDVIAMHQCGIENVVANSGTALSDKQARILHRFTNNITLLYDGDSAGIKAAIRGIDILLAEGMNVRVVLLPDGDDPDSYAGKHTSEEFIAYIKEQQTDFITFKTQLLMQEAQKDPIRRAEFINSIVESIAVIPDRITQTVYIKECSQIMQINEQILVDSVGKMVRDEVLRNIAQRQRREEQDAMRSPSDALPGVEDVPPMMEGEIPPPDTEMSAPVTLDNKPTTQQTMAAFQQQPENAALLQMEEDLIRLVIKYGEVPICELEMEDGSYQVVTLPVYINMSLQDLELELISPLHRQVLQEAIEHASDKDFKSEFYFMAHPVPEISQLTVKLTNPRYALSRTNSMNMSDESAQLLDVTIRLTNNYKIAVLKDRLKKAEDELKSPETLADMAKAEAIIRKQMEIRNVLLPLLKENGEQVIM
jgi:DNA primase